MTETLFGLTTPSLVNEADGIPYALGTRFTTNTAGTITHGRWYFPTTTPSASVQVQVSLYDVASPGTVLANASFSLVSTLGAWNQVAFASPVAITTGVTYEVAIWTPLRYVATGSFGYPTTGTNLTAPSPNGYFTANTPTPVMASSQSGASYFADVVFEPSMSGVTPDGTAVALALGSPASSIPAAAPTGLAVPLALGTPATSLNRTAAPTGLAVPLALGQPTTSLNRATAPTGIAIPVAFGNPTAGNPISPNGLAIALTLGSPAAGPTVVSAGTALGNWWSLYDIGREMRQLRLDDRAEPPQSCPNDGEPLQLDPRGRWRCSFDGWTWDGRAVL